MKKKRKKRSVKDISVNLKIGGIRLLIVKLLGRIFKNRIGIRYAEKCMLRKSLPELAEFHKWYYKKLTGCKLDYSHPQNASDKFQQLLIYDAQPYKTKWSDKYEAKRMAAEALGEEHVTKLYGVWNTFEEIDFDSLPSSFVLKATHGSGFDLIVKDKSKLNMNFAKAVAGRWLDANFGATFKCELHYRKIKPRLIAEEYLRPKEGDLIDYKIICILGKPVQLIFSNKKIGQTINFKIKNGKWGLPHYYESGVGFIYVPPEEIAMPKNLGGLLSTAEKLSAGMDFVRVDLYDVDGVIYFGELTFTPSGFVSGLWIDADNWTFLDDEMQAWAKTGLPEHITEL